MSNSFRRHVESFFDLILAPSLASAWWSVVVVASVCRWPDGNDGNG